jgi:alpha-1,2-mannosyltransferase
MVLAGLIDGARQARWLTRERIIAGGQLLLLIELTILAMLALWQHGVISSQAATTSSDFVSFYAAGKLALAGTPGLAYDQAAHFLTEQQFTAAGAPYQYFFYPPVFLLLCAPLALLPYYVAFYGFEIATLAAFAFTMRQILREPGWSWVGPVLAFPAIFWTFGLGQNAFLTAALFGGFTLMIERQPALAGVFLGLLCYKPHFGVLAPVALAAGGLWRSCLAAAATVAGLVLLSVALFGVAAWQEYWSAFTGSSAVYASGRIDLAGMVTPFGAARLCGLDASLAYLVQATVTAAMVLVVAWAWWRNPSRNLRAATLLTATLLAVPVALLYDRMLLLVAIGWLVREARSTGFRLWDKIVLLAAYLAPLVDYAVDSAWHLPLGPLISMAVLALALRRIGNAKVRHPDTQATTARSGDVAASAG